MIKPAKIEITYRFGRWWIIDHNNDSGSKLCGPYDDEEDAEIDAEGLFYFWRNELKGK
jgi:hypothetical protein